MDDLEHRAFGLRPRDVRGGPSRIPGARTLGRRLAELRACHGLTVADLADAAGLRHHVVEEFEEYGAISGENLLWLLEVVCAEDSLPEAFRHDRFRGRAEFLERWRVKTNVVRLRP